MTAAQQLGKKFEQRGEQRGIQKRNLEIARNMLAEGLALNLIRKLSGLSEEELAQLQSEKTPQNQH